MTTNKQPTTIEEYIAKYPVTVQGILQKVRQTIKKAAPHATEDIAYQMPAFKLQGKPLVYFGAWKDHIGFYALPSGTAAFREKLGPYKHAKGTVQFPLDKPLPYDLIAEMVAFRVQEVMQEG